VIITERERVAVERFNTDSNIEMAKPLIFTREARSIVRFITIYKLFLRMKIREVVVEEQIQ